VRPKITQVHAQQGVALGAVKEIYLEPCWKLPLSYEYMIGFPPEGYKYITAGALPERFFKAISRWGLSYRLLNSIDKVIPSVLAMSWLQRRMKPPQGTVLTWAHGHLVFRPEPWVVEVEYPSLLVGPHPKHLAKFRGAVERMLASPYCRKIRVWAAATRRAMLSQLDCKEFERKIEVIYHAVPARRFVKEYSNAKITLLHVGSGNIKGTFEGRGGQELLEAFARLCGRHDNVEFVLRCDVPTDLKAQYRRLKNLRIIDQMISREALEQEFRSASIFVWPAHSTSPFVLLEAMAHELPIVGVDFFATPEIVEDGKTGLLVPPSRDGLRRHGTDLRTGVDTPELYAPPLRADPELVEQLVKQLSLLIGSPELRRRMGRAGRWEVEHGKFSIGARNEKLKQMFDEATKDP